MSSKKLVIVESPAKARTIGAYLGPDYTVKASIGHVRDLPQPSDLPADMKKGPYGRFAVNVEDDFDPYYVVNADKRKTVKELRDALREADELYLATDEDREGEAIAWHLLEVLKPKVPVKRMVFHEITREAIQGALDATRDLNTHLVDAQETRRILDRLVGYEVSPLLWRKVRQGLSAGRVQSVATRLVVERERDRMAFVPATYFDLTATFTKDSKDAPFTAKLVSLDGTRLATGRDFGDDGALKARSNPPLVMDAPLAAALHDAVPGGTYAVSDVERKPYRRRPVAPFTTSTLQQEAGRKLRMSARDTMRTAQTLYENGYITYMRTDSTALSKEAVTAARAQAAELYGPDSIPAKPRVYGTTAKGAQEAHEAIRPAGRTFRTPDEVAGELRGREAALYELVWKRTVASQMNDATGTTDTVRVRGRVDLPAPGSESVPAGGHDLEFTASGTVITSRGFLAAYEEGRDAARYGDGRDDKRLPELTAGAALACVDVDRDGCEHTTTPPPRYTEASLVKALEERGIGRPSTYAATIGVIIDRGYVHRKGQTLIPSWLAFSVTRLLEDNLGELVDYDFTASLEEDLDRIASGEEDRVAWLRSFWDGEGDRPGLKGRVDNLGDIDARAVNSITLTPSVTLRVGRYGPYLEDADGNRANVPDDLAPDELSADAIAQAFAAKAADGRELGVDPATGHTIVVKDGRYGPYVTEVLPEGDDSTSKPRTASLFKSMSIETVSLEDALRLLSLPRTVGVDPSTGETITAQNGRYGPYLRRGKDSRSLTSEEQLFSLTLEEALAIYAAPKTRGRAAAKPPLREMGTDPATQATVVIKDGRFGPYITDGTTNVTVPRSSSVEDLTPEDAYRLLAEKRAKPKTTRKKAPAKKKTTRKAAGSARKTATKKTK